jgi:hypothetical protein
MVALFLFLFLKGMSGALAPFSYLVHDMLIYFTEFVECHMSVTTLLVSSLF